MRSLTLIATLALSACQIADRPTESETATLRNVIVTAHNVVRTRAQVGRTIAALTGADQAAMPVTDSAVGRTFQIGSNHTCVIVSDDRRPDGGDMIASCDGDALHVAVTVTRSDGRLWAEVHLDGMFED